MNYVGKLKQKLLSNALDLCKKESFSGTRRKTAFLFEELSMNFHPDSYDNIEQTFYELQRKFKKHGLIK